MPSDAVQCKPLEVVVSDRGIERAIKMLKRKLASEGVLRELKMRRHYMKPSVKRRKKQAEASLRLSILMARSIPRSLTTTSSGLH